MRSIRVFLLIILLASLAAAQRVSLAWDPSTTPGVSYNVYRSDLSGSYAMPLNMLPMSALVYDDSTVALGRTYYYVVRSVFGPDISVDSNQIFTIIPCSVGMWLAEYYRDRTLSGIPLATTCEQAVDNEWGDDGPASLTDEFSARWTGIFHNPVARAVQFTAITDDGMRAWVDDQLIIDQWHDQGRTQYVAAKFLTIGDHRYRVEYYENGGGAVAKFSWNDSVPVTTDVIRPMVQ